MLEKTERTALWLDTFEREIRAIEDRSGLPVDKWRVGGRASKQWPNREDAAFWREEGLRQFEAYIEWLDKSGWKIATMPDDKPGIEWEAEVWFGGTPVRMVVDAIYDVNGDWVVVDYKTGSRTPEWEMQISLYASALERVYGKRPKWGAYYMTRKAALSDLSSLERFGMDWFDYAFSTMNFMVDNDILPAHVGDHCGYCSVSEWCAAVNPQSDKAQQYPIIKGDKG